MNGTPVTLSPPGGTADNSPVGRLFYSAAEAAVITSLSRKEIYRLVERGDVEVAEYGKRRLIVARSLHDFAQRLIDQTTQKRQAEEATHPGGGAGTSPGGGAGTGPRERDAA